MEQRVNLYRPELDIRREIPIWARLVGTVGAAILAGTVLWWPEWITAQRLHQEVARQQETVSTLTASLAELTAAHRDPELERLEQAIAAMEQDREVLGEAAEALETVRGGLQGASFAAILEFLAKQRVPEVWVQRLTLRDGNVLFIEGHALTPGDVATYVDLLETYAGAAATVRDLLIRGEQEDRTVAFSLEYEAHGIQ